MIRRPQQLDEENMELLSRMLAQSELERDMRRDVVSLSRNTEWERAAREEEDRLRRTGTWGRPPPSIWEEERRMQQSGNSQEGETKIPQISQDEFLDSLNEVMERADQAFLQSWRNGREETQDAENTSNPWNIQDQDRRNIGWTSNRTNEGRSGWIRNENRPTDESSEETRLMREIDEEFKNMEERNEENKENNLPDE